ncbi:MAG: tetratricopeptide repeat protein [Prolixibacteraceae bacterium]
MKRKAVFITIFSFWAVTNLLAQTIQETWEFANLQYSRGNFKQALPEYQRVAFFDESGIYSDVYQKTAESFYALEQYDRALQNFDIASRLAENDSLKTELLFRKADCYFQQNNFLFALNELLVIPDPENLYLQTKYNLYMGIGNFGIGNFEESQEYFSTIITAGTLPELNEIFTGFEKFRKRFRPSKIQTMSIIFPGLGQFYSGYFASGLNSLLLVGSIATAGVYIWQVYGIPDALLSMGSWYYRYYSGGYQNAEILAIEKIGHEQEKVYREIMQLVQNNLMLKE